MLKIHESTTSSGRLEAVFLHEGDGALFLVAEDGKHELPPHALAAVMDRFGAALDPTERLDVVDALHLGDGSAIRHVRHLGLYDVIARDYLVLDAPGRDPLCALASTVVAALDHLARAARRA